MVWNTCRIHVIFAFGILQNICNIQTSILYQNILLICVIFTPIFTCEYDGICPFSCSASGISFFSFPSGKSVVQQQKKKGMGLNSANAKTSILHHAVESARGISPKTRTSQDIRRSSSIASSARKRFAYG